MGCRACPCCHVSGASTHTSPLSGGGRRSKSHVVQQPPDRPQLKLALRPAIQLPYCGACHAACSRSAHASCVACVWQCGAWVTPPSSAESCRHGEYSLCAWPFDTKAGACRGVKCVLAQLRECYLSVSACNGLTRCSEKFSALPDYGRQLAPRKTFLRLSGLNAVC